MQAHMRSLASAPGARGSRTATRPRAPVQLGRARPVCRFQQPAKEHHLKNHSTPPDVLHRVEDELTEFCSLEASDPAACRTVRDWYVHKVEDAEAHKALGQAVGDEELTALQKTVRELTSTGSTKAVYQALQSMKRAEERKAEEMAAVAAGREVPSAPKNLPLPESAKPNPSMGGLTLADKELLAKLFAKLDTDGNGYLTWNEFVDAMHLIGDDMSEEDTLLVGSILDLQGHVTLEQFIAIVEEAEAQRQYAGSDAYFLSHACHIDRSPNIGQL